MTDARHAQLGKVFFSEGRKMGALDLVLLEALTVLPKINAGEPVPHIVLVPQVQRFLVEGAQCKERRGHSGGMSGRRRAAPAARASHDEAHLLRLVGQTEAGGFQDGGGRSGRGSQAEASDGSEWV